MWDKPWTRSEEHCIKIWIHEPVLWDVERYFSSPGFGACHSNDKTRIKFS